MVLFKFSHKQIFLFWDKNFPKKLLFILVPLILAVYVLINQNKSGVFQLSKPYAVKSGGVLDINDINVYKGRDLPVAKVRTYPVSNSKGTVIYIPQYHKNPGSDSDDPKNDSAQVAQNEIYQIVKFLHNGLKVNLMMVEGELYGEVPVGKITGTAKKLEDRNVFVQNFQNLEKKFNKDIIDSSLQKDLCGKVYSEVGKVDRDIILQGAPIKLKIEDTDRNLVLYGTENENTLEQSRVLVRNYIYLQDRFDQLQRTSSADNFPGNSFNLDDDSLKTLMKLFQRNPVLEEFETLKTEALLLGKKEIVSVISTNEDLFSKLIDDNTVLNQPVLPQDTGTGRLDNPYQDISDVNQVKKMLDIAENKINQIVVDQRNRETSENFIKSLKEVNNNIGILAFGAGHEDGLVKEFNKRGISVIIITSDEVNKRNNS